MSRPQPFRNLIVTAFVIASLAAGLTPAAPAAAGPPVPPGAQIGSLFASGTIQGTDTFGVTVSGLTVGNWYTIASTGGQVNVFYPYGLEYVCGLELRPGSGGPTVNIGNYASSSWVSVYDNMGACPSPSQGWQSYSRFWFVAPESSIRVRVYDGNWSDNDGTLNFEVYNVFTDTTSPVTTANISCTAGNAGWCLSAATVTLSATDDDSGVAATYYDASTYSGPVTVSTQGTTGFSYYSVDNSGNTESAQTGSVMIDTVAPASTLTSHANGQAVHNTLALSGAVSDATSGVGGVEVSVGGGAWTPAAVGSGSWSYSLDTTGFGDGPLIVQVRATDVAGNVQPTSGPGSTAVTLNVDNTNPSVSHSLSGTLGNNNWYVTNVIVSLSAADSGTGIAAIALDGAPYSTPVTVSTPGPSDLPYVATDNAGNSSAVGQAIFQIDTQAPTTTLASHANGDAISDTVTLGGAVSDATSGVSSVEVSVEGGPWAAASVASGNWSLDLDTTGLADGPITIRVRATDNAGNVQPISGAGSTSVSLLVDNTNPTISHALSGTMGDNNWYVSAVVVTLTASDAESGIQTITLNGAPYSSPVTVNTQGPTSWDYSATDQAGNTSPTGSLSFLIDSVRPNSTIGSHANDDLVSGLINLSGSVNDATSGVGGLDVSIDDGATWSAATVNSGSWSYSLDTSALSDGPLTVLARARDVAGNQQATSGPGSTQIVLDVDNTPPTAWVSAPGTFCPLCNQDINITYGAADDDGIAAWVLSVDGFGQLDSGAGEPAASAMHTWDGVGVAPGNQIIRLTVTDAAGNTSEATDTVTITLPAPPTATIDLGCPVPGDHGWCRAPVSVHLSGSVPGISISRLNYNYDGAANTINGSRYTFVETAPGVTHVITLTATDTLGRTSSTVSGSFKIDGEVPFIAFEGATAEQLKLSVLDTHSGIARWTAQVFDASGASVFWIERTTAFSGVLDWLPPHSGQYTLEIFARDWAGNEIGSGAREFTIDLPLLAQVVNPVVAIFAPSARPTPTPAATTAAPVTATHEPSPTASAEPAPTSAPAAIAAANVEPATTVPEAAPRVIITGIVFADYNRDGLQNDHEPGMGQMQIEIVVGDTGHVIALTTGLDGSYSVELPRGQRYLIRVITPGGLFLTTPGSALVFETDSRGVALFGLGANPLGFWLIGLVGMFGLVWGGSTALDRRAGAVRSLASELKGLAARRLGES